MSSTLNAIKTAATSLHGVVKFLHDPDTPLPVTNGQQQMFSKKFASRPVQPLTGGIDITEFI